MNDIGTASAMNAPSHPPHRPTETPPDRTARRAELPAAVCAVPLKGLRTRRRRGPSGRSPSRAKGRDRACLLPRRPGRMPRSSGSLRAWASIWRSPRVRARPIISDVGCMLGRRQGPTWRGFERTACARVALVAKSAGHSDGISREPVAADVSAFEEGQLLGEAGEETGVEIGVAAGLSGERGFEQLNGALVDHARVSPERAHTRAGVAERGAGEPVVIVLADQGDGALKVGRATWGAAGAPSASPWANLRSANTPEVALAPSAVSYAIAQWRAASS